jgi:hypothetical protein
MRQNFNRIRRCGPNIAATEYGGSVDARVGKFNYSHRYPIGLSVRLHIAPLVLASGVPVALSFGDFASWAPAILPSANIEPTLSSTQTPPLKAALPASRGMQNKSCRKRVRRSLEQMPAEGSEEYQM